MYTFLEPSLITEAQAYQWLPIISLGLAVVLSFISLLMMKS